MSQDRPQPLALVGGRRVPEEALEQNDRAQKIQSMADARGCVEVSVQRIVVRNRGGRQQYGGVSSSGMWSRIVDTFGDNLDIFFDSGIWCGADIIKALALGAKSVHVGWPYAHGLAIEGEAGVKHVLRAMCRDLMINMHVTGLRCLDEVDRDILVEERELFQGACIGDRKCVHAEEICSCFHCWPKQQWEMSGAHANERTPWLTQATLEMSPVTVYKGVKYVMSTYQNSGSWVSTRLLLSIDPSTPFKHPSNLCSAFGLPRDTWPDI